MSDRSRLGDITLALVALATTIFMAGTIAALVIGQYAKIHEVNAAYQQNAKRDRTNSSNEIAESCENKTAAAFHSCIVDHLESYYAKQTTNQDLQAQQDMAFWAACLFFSSTGLTLVGIYLLWQTLGATRQTLVATRDTLIEAGKTTKAAEDGNAILKSEQRPWLKVVPTFPDGMTIHNNTLMFGVRPIIQNVGFGLARDVWIEVKSILSSDTHKPDITSEFGSFFTSVNNKRVVRNFPIGGNIFPNDPTSPGNFVQVIEGDELHGVDLAVTESALSLHIFCCCIYWSADRVPYITANAYRLFEHIDGGKKFITVGSCDLTGDEIIADATFQPNYIT